MSSRQFKLLVVLVVVSGLVGGALGSWLLPGRAAFAQEEALEVVTARQFRLVDEDAGAEHSTETPLRPTGSGVERPTVRR